MTSSTAPPAATHGKVASLRGLARRIRRMPLWLLALIFSPPLVVTLVWRAVTPWWWWRDFDAVICAGQRAAAHLPIYAAHPACPGLQPADFVYPPQVAWLAAPLVQHVSPEALRLGFALLQAGVCLWLGWLMLIRPLPHLSQRARIPALGLVDGGIIVCGNLAIACHALVAASLLTLKRSRWLFIVAVALVSVLKPVYATYLVVLLLDKAPWRVRLARTAAGVAALAAVGAALWATGGSEFAAWREALDRMVVHGKPGGGLVGLFAVLGLPTTGPLPILAFLAFAGLMTIAGLAIAEAREGGFSADERWLFGLGLAQLINPRPMGYDLLVMAPLVAITSLAAADVSVEAQAVARRWLLLACLAFWTLTNVWMGSTASVVAPPLLSAGVLGVGLTLAWRRLPALMDRLGLRPSSCASQQS
jgi:hypothetical protein